MPTNTEMQKKALAIRDAHLALLDLKNVIDEAARIIHNVEFEAVHLAISAKSKGDISSKMKAVLSRLGSIDFEGVTEPGSTKSRCSHVVGRLFRDTSVAIACSRLVTSQ